MAITNRKDILDVSRVKSISTDLDRVVYYVDQAIEKLNEAKKNAGVEYLQTDQGNTYPTAIQAVISNLEDYKSKINTVKTTLIDDAQRYHDDELASFNKWEQENLKNNN